MIEMKKVLHIVPSLSRMGIMACLMNYYREIDREQVQFDFIYSNPKSVDATLQEEIRSLGGKETLIPMVTAWGFLRALKIMYRFFKIYAKEYDILHVHQMGPGFTYLFLGWVFGIKIRIAHSHNTCYSPYWARAIRNAIYIYPFKRFATHIWECSKLAGEFLFGKRKRADTLLSLLPCERISRVENARTHNFDITLDAPKLVGKYLSL